LESGFEVLRRWKAHPKLQDIGIIIWTAMGETEQRLCEYFGIKGVIPKWAGPKELEQAVRAHSAGDPRRTDSTCEAALGYKIVHTNAAVLSPLSRNWWS
jgi:DNA-binding response OmpR family regulator